MFNNGLKFRFITSNLLLIIACIPTLVYSQITWDKAFGYGSEEWGHSVIQTVDTGYILCGYTDNYQFKYDDVYLIKTDETGNIEWTKNYGSSALEYGYRISATSDGGFIIAGDRYSPMYNTIKAYLLKTDFFGDTLWTKLFTGLGDATARCAIETDDGGYVFCGNTGGPNGNDAYLVKLDSSGDMIWEKAFSGTRDDYAYDVKPTYDGGYIICGGTEIDPGNYDALIIKTDSMGDTLWTRHFGGPGADDAFSVIQNRDSTYFVCGESWNTSEPTYFDVYLIKINNQGDSIWTKRYGGNMDGAGYSIAQTKDNNIIIGGRSRVSVIGKFDMYLIKINQEGDLLWDQIIGGSENEACYSVDVTYDDGYILCGYTMSYGAGNSDIYLVKTDSEGLLTNIFDIKNDHNSIGSIHPNPNNGNFWFDLPEGPVDIKIFDPQGQTVYRQKYNQDHSTSRIQIDLRNMSKGLYILRLNRNNEILQSYKLIIN